MWKKGLLKRDVGAKKERRGYERKRKDNPCGGRDCSGCHREESIEK